MIDWSKHLRKQRKTGWCGVACVQMALSACGIRRPQWLIALYVYKRWWGTSHQIMLAYLTKYFQVVNYKNSATLKDIKYHLKEGHIVIVNWWDETDGHYTIVSKYENKTLTMVDPDGTRAGIWEVSSSYFKEHWYDYVDLNKRIFIEGWMLWIDPKTKK